MSLSIVFASWCYSSLFSFEGELNLTESFPQCISFDISTYSIIDLG